MKPYIHIIIYTAITACALCSCQKHTDSQIRKPKIAVSIEPQRNIAEAITGDDFEIVTVLDRGANPETFEPSMSKRVAIEDCAAYLSIGAFTFEDMLIRSSNSNIVTFNTSDGITPVFGTHEHACDKQHIHNAEGDADPHVWTSVQNARIIAANIANAASKINPDHSVIYKSNLDSLCSLIDSLDRQIAVRLASAPSKSFVIWHPSLSYMSRDYGLRQIAIGQESKEISPRQLRHIIDEATGDSVRVFFYQKEFDSRQAETISQRMGTRLVAIDPLAYDWMSQLKLIADELSKR